MENQDSRTGSFLHFNARKSLFFVAIWLRMILQNSFDWKMEFEYSNNTPPVRREIDMLRVSQNRAIRKIIGILWEGEIVKRLEHAIKENYMDMCGREEKFTQSFGGET